MSRHSRTTQDSPVPFERTLVFFPFHQHLGMLPLTGCQTQDFMAQWGMNHQFHTVSTTMDTSQKTACSSSQNTNITKSERANPCHHLLYKFQDVLLRLWSTSHVPGYTTGYCKRGWSAAWGKKLSHYIGRICSMHTGVGNSYEAWVLSSPGDGIIYCDFK